MRKKLHVKVGDRVEVISGTSKGQQGEVLAIDRKKERVIVSGANLVKKHVKPSADNPQGGIKSMEAGVHISNVMLTQGGTTSRTGHKIDESGKKVRYFKKNGEVLQS